MSNTDDFFCPCFTDDCPKDPLRIMRSRARNAPLALHIERTATGVDPVTAAYHASRCWWQVVVALSLANMSSQTEDALGLRVGDRWPHDPDTIRDAAPRALTLEDFTGTSGILVPVSGH